MTIDFEARRRQAESDPNKVRCAHCGAWIFSRATRCPKCGVNFLGEAFQFSHPELDEIPGDRITRRRRALLIAFILTILLIVGVSLYFAR